MINRVSTSLIAITLLGVGCSTIVHGTTQQVVINTVPQGATASVPGNECVTPCELLMERNEKTVLIKRDGFDIVMYPLVKRRHVGTGVFGNILTLGFGMIVDRVNGSVFEIQPVYVTLNRTEP